MNNKFEHIKLTTRKDFLQDEIDMKIRAVKSANAEDILAHGLTELELESAKLLELLVIQSKGCRATINIRMQLRDE
tara:strand:+ start:108 stop:335 length:228 start_codon:yes stop_codon:yes gene_type:complete